MRILAEQECFKVRLNEAMETEFRTLLFSASRQRHATHFWPVSNAKCTCMRYFVFVFQILHFPLLLVGPVFSNPAISVPHLPVEDDSSTDIFQQVLLNWAMATYTVV